MLINLVKYNVLEKSEREVYEASILTLIKQYGLIEFLDTVQQIREEQEEEE